MSVTLLSKQPHSIGFSPNITGLPSCGEKLYGGVNLLYMVQDLLSTVQNMLAGFALISKNIENEHSSKWEIKTAANRPVVTLCYKEIHSDNTEDEPEVVVPEVNLRSPPNQMEQVNTEKMAADGQNKSSVAVPITLMHENGNIWENLSKCLSAPKARIHTEGHPEFISPSSKQGNFPDTLINGQNTLKINSKPHLQEKEYSSNKNFLPNLNNHTPPGTGDGNCIPLCQNTSKEIICRTCNLLHAGECRINVGHSEESHHLINRSFHSVESQKRKETISSPESQNSDNCGLRKTCKDYPRRTRQPPEVYTARDANGSYLEEIFNNDFDKSIVTFGMKESEDEIYSCGFCNKKFSVLSKKNRHERTHTGERPYFCTFCNKSFAQLTNKKIHEYTHTGEKPYPCNYCGRRFAQLSNKKSHERIHWREQNLNLKPVPSKIMLN